MEGGGCGSVDCNVHEAARPHALDQVVDVAAEGHGEGGGCKEGAGRVRSAAERGCRGAEAGEWAASRSCHGTYK